MSERKQPNRQRCLAVGCNPKLKNAEAARAHKDETGHRTAAWPVRSAAGQAQARQRNRSGYYDKYNVGEKSAVARGLVPSFGVRDEYGADGIYDRGEWGETAFGEDDF